MIVLGVTGNLASGKTAVAEAFHKMGAKVINADALARKLIRKGTPIHKAIVKIFGEKFLMKNKEIDRRKLAWHVFSNPGERKKLNILTHPGVILEVYQIIEKLKNKKGILVLDVPLLFESRMQKLVDVTLVVCSSEKDMLSRAARRGVPRELAKKILASQWPLSKKARLSDYVIQNEGSLKELEAKAKKIYEQLYTTVPCSGVPGSLFEPGSLVHGTQTTSLIKRRKYQDGH